jgi:fructose PTS system EIIBC or EIIC component
MGRIPRSRGPTLHDNALLTLALLLVAGLAAGALAKRVHLPSVTGQILVGILLGPSVLDVFGPRDGHALRAVLDFALGLMAVAVGSHLRFRRLANAKRRLGLLVAFEATLTPALVFAVVMVSGAAPWPAALLLATISISTAPATILALVSEARARGAFVKTLLAGVALDNLACITLFEVARAIARADMAPGGGTDVVAMVLRPMQQLGLAGALGGGVGLALVASTRNIHRPDRVTALSLVAILLATGLATQLGVSALLAGLFLGVTLANLTPSKEEIGHVVFADFEHAIFAVFFVVAGLELSFEHALRGGLLAVLVFGARAVGKLTAARLAMRLAGATETIRRYLGSALVPQAGLAVGLMLLVTEDPTLAPVHDVVLSVVLTVVLMNELVGPLFTRRALARSGEAGLDRPRVLDFLHEEHIVTGLTARSMEEAIEALAGHLVRTRKLTVDLPTLVQGALDRERSQSTCLGEGLAVPHARLAASAEVVGVLGISREGLDLPTPDGKPVHCVVLLVTPQGEEDRHLRVLAALAQVVGGNADLRAALYDASSPAHAHEILHAGEAAKDFNYFLDGDGP